MAVIKMSTKKFINQQDIIDELKRVIASDKFNREDLKLACSAIMDIMYGPNEVEFMDEKLSGEQKHEAFNLHEFKPYVCWNYNDMCVVILNPMGVSEHIMKGYNTLPLHELIKIISQ